MSPSLLPATGRRAGRLPASTARTTTFRAFDRVSAAAVHAPGARDDVASGGYEDPGDVLVLAFVTAGAVASTVGRETHLRGRGEMALSQLTRVDAVGMSLDFRSVSLRLSADLVHASPREVDVLMRRPFSQSDPIPRLLGMMCRELLSPQTRLGPGVTTALTQSVVNLCSGLFDDALGRNSPPERSSHNLVTQARRYIAVNAACPSVDPHRVADAVQVSVRTLHKAFEHEPESVAQAILAARLELSERLLRTDSSSIEDVAARSGFSSPSTFSRAFRRAHDVTPREWRRTHRE